MAKTDPAPPAGDTDPNPSATTEAVETLNPAGTAPADPDQASVAAAHARHEQQKSLAERTEAGMWEGIRAGMSRQEALAASQRANGTAPENKALGGAPENRGA